MSILVGSATRRFVEVSRALYEKARLSFWAITMPRLTLRFRLGWKNLLFDSLNWVVKWYLIIRFLTSPKHSYPKDEYKFTKDNRRLWG